jgi:hypothetical protein
MVAVTATLELLALAVGSTLAGNLFIFSVPPAMSSLFRMPKNGRK